MLARRVLVALSALLFVSPVLAQGDYLTALYGRGVHAFHDGNYVQAQRYFDEAVALGSTDPRLYYFSALTKMRQGRRDEAEADIRMAAMLEVQGAGTYDVGRALERVQGTRRLELERKRRDFKLVALQEQAQQPKTTDDQQYLRGPVDATPAPPRVDDRGLPPEPTDPYAGGTGGETGPEQPPRAEANREDEMFFRPEEEQPPPEEKEIDPFADADDPFAADDTASPAAPAKPGSSKKIMGSLFRAVTKAIPGERKAAEGSGAAGAKDASSDDDPFGGPPAPAADEGEDPFGSEPAPPPDEDEDPFGSEPAPPPDEDVDPFGDDAGDAELEDPFGG